MPRCHSPGDNGKFLDVASAHALATQADNEVKCASNRRRWQDAVGTFVLLFSAFIVGTLVWFSGWAARDSPQWQQSMHHIHGSGPVLEVQVMSRVNDGPFSLTGSFSLAGKSIYFLMVDRFARDVGTSTTRCAGSDWCGGTLRGIIAKLDYIKGMGFDCIWITPVVKQLGTDPGSGTTGYHGYWAYEWFEVDEHFGTKQDLKDLSDALHGRNMCLVYDMVVNHVGPVLSSEAVAKVSPFNQTRFLNQLDKEPGDSFDNYTACMRNKRPNCQTPPQAFAFGKPTNHSGDCGVGAYACDGYNETRVLSGWFFNLGDLNHSVLEVRQELLRWAVHMVQSYKIDVVRLDTAPYVPKDFLAELQAAVPAEVIGEVTTTNMTFHASYQKASASDASLGLLPGSKVLDGILNFPLSWAAPGEFCGSSFNLTNLGKVMRLQMTSGLYSQLDLLGNFPDNHDFGPRIGQHCMASKARWANVLAFTMFARGVPIVYYGTEQDLHGKMGLRDSLWEYGYNANSWLYSFFANANKARRDYNLGVSDAEVISAGEEYLVFTRGGLFGAWVFLTNCLPGNASNQTFVFPVGPPVPPIGRIWAELLGLSGQGSEPRAAHLDEETGGLLAPGCLPQVLALVPSGTLLDNTMSCKRHQPVGSAHCQRGSRRAPGVW